MKAMSSITSAVPSDLLVPTKHSITLSVKPFELELLIPLKATFKQEWKSSEFARSCFCSGTGWLSRARFGSELFFYFFFELFFCNSAAQVYESKGKIPQIYMRFNYLLSNTIKRGRCRHGHHLDIIPILSLRAPKKRKQWSSGCI